MNKYEIRRLNFQHVIDSEFNGNAAAFARKIDKDSSYINRCLYEEGKAGKKRIGDTLVEAACSALGKAPGWYDTPKWDSSQTGAPGIPLLNSINTHDKNVMEHPNGYAIPGTSVDSGHSGDYRLPLIPDSLPMLDRTEVLHWQESISQHKQNPVQGMISNIPINPSMFKYRVLGDDMAPQFADGDILAIDPTRTAENAHYVLAEINGDPAVRQLMRIAGEWWLTLKNSAYAEMKKPLAEAKIIGVVVAKLPPPTLYI